MAFVAIALLASVAASPSSAHEAPRLVRDVARAAHKAFSVPQDGHGVLEAIRRDPAAGALRVGLAFPDAVREARALSVVLPAPPDTDADTTVSFLGLKFAQHAEQEYSLYHHDEETGSEGSLVVTGADVLGTIRRNGEDYEVRPLGGGLTAIYRYDTGSLPECGVSGGPVGTSLREYPHPLAGQHHHDRARQDSNPPSPSANGSEVMDVLVVYTPQARIAAGNIDLLIRLFVEDANRRYANSEIRHRIRLVHSHETEYEQEHTMDIDIDRIRIPEDGYMDEVHALRNEYGADLVALLVGHSTATECGIGNLYVGASDASEYAFSVTGQNCRSGTFAHELGHNQGARHDPVASTNDAFPYGHGTCNSEQKWRSAMGYRSSGDCDERVPYFSNPNVSYRGIPTGDEILRNNARVINETARVIANYRLAFPPPHAIPLVMSADNEAQQGFVRIINRSDRGGSVRIHAIDDEGQRFGPVFLSLEANASAHFNSNDLEDGNPSKGLSARVGDGSGNWRLALSTELDIEARAYIRTSDGFLTSIHQVAAESGDAATRHHVPIFNPGSNRDQQSWLRLINVSDRAATIDISGEDDRGEAPPEGEVRLTLPAGAARVLTAEELEQGGDAFSGRFGDGEGKWRLSVRADRPIQIMSLLFSRPTGNLTNLSR